jgi:hypothetical protein
MEVERNLFNMPMKPFIKYLLFLCFDLRGRGPGEGMLDLMISRIAVNLD